MRLLSDEQRAAIARAIRATTDPERIVLFGSEAAGKATSDSDIDLLVIEKEPFTPGRGRRRRAAQIRRALPEFGMSYDVLVYDVREYDKWRDTENHVICWATREGEVLYGERERPCEGDASNGRIGSGRGPRDDLDADARTVRG